MQWRNGPALALCYMLRCRDVLPPKPLQLAKTESKSQKAFIEKKSHFYKFYTCCLVQLSFQMTVFKKKRKIYFDHKWECW
jgi:hypothetical protein